ncbi:MAG: EVE domain-containing protein [Deltaproteobacteria bacterium]|nr:EVE domain-containing protein [Deltaproteobacteria bacterium]
MRHWLLKTEPEVFSIDDLLAAPKRTTGWDGVRNFQARNMLRDDLKLGDRILIYHSNAEPPGVAGVAEVAREGYVDETQFDPDDHHFDPKSKREAPQWFKVDVRGVEKLARVVGLPELRDNPKLEGMPLLRPGQRLSVQPVSPEHYELILAMAKAAPKESAPAPKAAPKASKASKAKGKSAKAKKT